MFKSTHNMMKICFRIIPQTPLLVSSGKSFDVTHPDIEFIRLLTPEGETVYIPGSSLKGVLRAGCESILEESKNFTGEICYASEEMCPKKYEDKCKDEKLPYKFHCPVCRMFGSGHLASRLEITDIFPYALEETPVKKRERIKTVEQMLSSRPGIQINRKLGNTESGALFNYEILGGGELFGEMILTNYQLYQPGLLFTLLDLANEGLLRFGHSKSRGLGVIYIKVDTIEIMQMGQLRGDTIKGVGTLEKYRDYRLYMTDGETIDKAFTKWHKDQTLYSQLTFTDSTIIDEVTGHFKDKIGTFLG